MEIEHDDDLPATQGHQDVVGGCFRGGDVFEMVINWAEVDH